MSLPPDAVLPLPADRPLAGPYRTSFQELFAGRIAPERARLLDRTLPIWQQTVDGAAAVQAAEDVLVAVSENQTSPQGDAAAVAACSDALLQQRREFVRAVCDYNQGIAEYGLTVAAPGPHHN